MIDPQAFRRFKDTIDAIPVETLDGWSEMTASWGAHLDQIRAGARVDGMPPEQQGALAMATVFLSIVDGPEQQLMGLLATRFALDAIGGDRRAG